MDLELTLADRSSIWLDTTAIIAVFEESSGTRIVVAGPDDQRVEVNVLESFEAVSDLMNTTDPGKVPGDFME
jgi:hypothetical protein